MSDDFDDDYRHGVGGNSVDPSTAAKLQQYVERIERLNEEIKAVQDDRKDVYTELKSQGFDAPTVRKLIAIRKLDPNKRKEAEALLETYSIALGLI